MTIQTNNEDVVYITIHDTTFYIDYSLEKPIVQIWKDEEPKVIDLIPETDNPENQ
jgi:hypothetical protein